MKNILILVGSANKNGNTARLAAAFAEGAKAAGHTVTAVNLNEAGINGCLGCNACRRNRIPCVQKDGMTRIYPLLEQADTVVLASPLYYWTISASTKAFIERLYSVSDPSVRPPMGRYEQYPEKDCLLLMTAADNYFWTFEQAVSYYRFALARYLGWNDKGMLLAGGCGGSHTDRKMDPRHLADARALGASL